MNMLKRTTGIQLNNNFCFVMIELIFMIFGITAFKTNGIFIKVLFSKIIGIFLFSIAIYIFFTKLIHFIYIIYRREIIQNFYIYDSQKMHEIYSFLFDSGIAILTIFYMFLTLVLPEEIQYNDYWNAIGILILGELLIKIFYKEPIEKIKIKKVREIIYSTVNIFMFLEIIIFTHTFLVSFLENKLKIHEIMSLNSSWISSILLMFVIPYVVAFSSIVMVPDFKIKEWMKGVLKIVHSISLILGSATFLTKLYEEKIDSTHWVMAITLVTVFINFFTGCINNIYEHRKLHNQKRAREIYRNIMRLDDFNNISVSELRECCYYGGETFIDLLYLKPELLNLLKSIERPEPLDLNKNIN
ncbi:hypothetical protein [Anaerostipes sp.]|uniref:hypothetical protein n=1 Tax=Anaerostipes sp. TaxID=1872530 RepID=UPI00399582FC